MTKTFTLTHEELCKILAKYFGVNQQQTYTVTYTPTYDDELVGRVVNGIKQVNVVIKDD